jgi:hypothetical protein
MKQLLNKKLFKIVLFIFLGGMGGFAYFYFIGCQTGSCPITRNPYISTGYGMLIGLLISYDTKKKKKQEE